MIECPRGDRRCYCTTMPGPKWRECWEIARKEARTLVTGFSLEIDGDPVYVKRMLESVWKEMERCYHSFQREHEMEMEIVTLSGPMPIRLGGPFIGTVTLRTKEIT